MQRKVWMVPYIGVYRSKNTNTLMKRHTKEVTKKLFGELVEYLDIRIGKNKSKQETLYLCF